MPHIFPTSANKTIGDEFGDYYPAFARSAQSAETLRNVLQYTDRNRPFVVFEYDRSAVLFFTIYGWKQENIFL